MIHDAIVVGIGGYVNGVLHAGEGSLAKAMIYGPRPNEDGSFTRNASDVMKIVSLGEGSHANHHEHPGQLRFNDNPLLDAGGVIGELLVKAGLAEEGQPPAEFEPAA